MDRRTFLSSSAAALAAASSGSLVASQPGAGPARPRRYAIVGTGSRGSSMWGKGVRDKWRCWTCRRIKAFDSRSKVDVPTADGGHGGADDALRNVIFRRPQVADHLRVPDSRAGALSALTGIAAWRSCEENRPITISDLVTF